MAVASHLLQPTFSKVLLLSKSTHKNITGQFNLITLASLFAYRAKFLLPTSPNKD